MVIIIKNTYDCTTSLAIVFKTRFWRIKLYNSFIILLFLYDDFKLLPKNDIPPIHMQIFFLSKHKSRSRSFFDIEIREETPQTCENSTKENFCRVRHNIFRCDLFDNKQKKHCIQIFIKLFKLFVKQQVVDSSFLFRND